MTVEELKLSKEACEALYHNAFMSYKQGKYDDAESQFRVLTMVDTRTRKHWMGLGAALQQQKKHGEAIQAYELAAALDASDPFVHIYAADCFFALGQKKEGLFALDCAERAVKLQKEPNQNIFAHVELMRQAWKR